MSLQQLDEHAGALDIEGRHRLKRDQIAAFIGYEQANRYIPASGTPRMPIDTQIAQLENAQLEAGVEIQIMPNQMHAAHLEAHLPRMRIIAAMVESEEMDLEEGTRRLLPLHAHATQHLTGLETDPTIDILTAKYRQELKSFGEIINNGVKHIQKLEKERQDQEAQAQAQAAQEGQADPSELTPEILAMLQKHRVTLQLMEERGNAELAIRLQKAEQERAIRAADAAAKVAIG